jgi:hypothetical protein
MVKQMRRLFLPECVPVHLMLRNFTFRVTRVQCNVSKIMKCNSLHLTPGQANSSFSKYDLDLLPVREQHQEEILK